MNNCAWCGEEFEPPDEVILDNLVIQDHLSVFHIECWQIFVGVFESLDNPFSIW